tara:strand:+ start:65 stop:775 length:711 start_codon:yes stop_codon:yes gene_type:complete
MKSFLKEIESKFRELEEKKLDRDGDGDVDSDDYLAAKDAAIQAAMKKEEAKPDFLDLDRDGDRDETMKQAAAQANEDIVCEMCGEVHEGHCNSKHEDVDEAHCNTKQEDIEEASFSGGAGAFSPANWVKNPKAPKKKYKWASVSEAMDKKYEKLIESYSKFATGNPKSTPSQTVNGTIKEVAKKLQEIEQLVKYTSRLKNESGIAGSTYGKSTHNALNKISERLLKISERVRSLGE